MTSKHLICVLFFSLLWISHIDTGPSWEETEPVFHFSPPHWWSRPALNQPTSNSLCLECLNLYKHLAFCAWSTVFATLGFGKSRSVQNRQVFIISKKGLAGILLLSCVECYDIVAKECPISVAKKLDLWKISEIDWVSAWNFQLGQGADGSHQCILEKIQTHQMCHLIVNSH